MIEKIARNDMVVARKKIENETKSPIFSGRKDTLVPTRQSLKVPKVLAAQYKHPNSNHHISIYKPHQRHGQH